MDCRTRMAFIQDEEEEIDAERESAQIFHFPSASEILENYGWLILFGSLLVITAYKKFILPKLETIKARKELAERKKFDATAREIFAEKMKAARERVQAKYDADAIREQERQEKKKIEKLNQKIRESGIKVVEISQPLVATDAKRGKIVDPKTYVLNLVNSVPVVVFSKTLCSYCRKAKQALSIYRLPHEFYKVIELDEMESGSEVQDVLLEMTGARSVPRVFIGGKCIGGGDDTVAAHRDGRLQKMLINAGVLG